MQYDLGEEKNLREVNKNYFLLAFVIIAIIFGVFLAMNLGKEKCGDKICGPGENCYTCPEDCRCLSGEYCSETEKKCVKPICGNNKCEILENCSSCPKDCGSCPSRCGDGKCEENETCSSCPEDCGTCPTTPKCGDGKCEEGENCYTCPKDCKCLEGKYCSIQEKKCIKPTCGNGKCEPYENPDTCCLDCKCSIPGEVCNKETKKCEMQEMNISDGRAINLTIGYYKGQNLTVKSIEVRGIRTYYGKLMKIVRVQIYNESGFRYAGVTEEEKVIELPII